MTEKSYVVQFTQSNVSKLEKTPGYSQEKSE